MIVMVIVDTVTNNNEYIDNIDDVEDYNDNDKLSNNNDENKKTMIKIQ